MPTVLALESTCDDTAAAVVREGPVGDRILSQVVFGQDALHADFGGIVPEIAARAHAEKIDIAAREALDRSGLGLRDLDGVAVSAGPGLIGGVLSGVMCAKGIAAASGLPLVGVNHLAGHALTPRLTDDVAYPYLVLLVSGGHCQFLAVEAPDAFVRLGGTIDDAPGEAFDKTARLLGLGQPGGPEIEALAMSGDPNRFPLPRPLLDKPGCDMSFSGLKTAVLRTRDSVMSEDGTIARSDAADIAAAFQLAVADILAEKSARALAGFGERSLSGSVFAVAGGVAANQTVRAALQAVSRQSGMEFLAPPLALCTDNAAMIGWAGLERLAAGKTDGLDLAARPRWPLDRTRPALLGSGKKGPKS